MNKKLKVIKYKKIIRSIKKGLQDIKNSNTHPIDELWDKLDNAKHHI